MPTSIIDPLLLWLLFAASAGAFIGLIRQWSNDAVHHLDSAAGARTYSMWSVLGYLSAHIDQQYAHHFFLVAAFCFCVVILSGQWLAVLAKQTFGLTGVTAALLTFLVGSLVAWHSVVLAIVVCVVASITLSVKEYTKRFTHHLTPTDIFTVLQFVAITGIILPLVPDRDIGPYHAINFSKLWLMVIFISGTNFAGYMLMRRFGSAAGSLLTGIIGGLVSSTATTLSFSRQSKETPANSREYAMAILLACTVMLARTWLLLVAIDLPTSNRLILPFALMSLPGICLGLRRYLRKGDQKTTEQPDYRNPLRLKAAFKFAALYGIVVMVIRAAQQYHLGHTGLYLISAASGFTDINAPALSISNMAKDGVVLSTVASSAIVLAGISNTVAKMLIAMTLGSVELRRTVVYALGSTIILGLLGLGIQAAL